MHAEKCHWVPQQTGRWLGFDIDLKKGTISIPHEKIQRLRETLLGTRESLALQARTVASIVGTIISMGLGIGPVAWLRTRSLYALLESRQSWYDKLVVSTDAREENEFWLHSSEKYNGQNI